MTRKNREEQTFVQQMMYLLTAPGVTMPGYEDTFSPHNADAKLQRLIHHKEIFEQGYCTEFEAMLYISTASLMHPLNRDWGDIYFYLFQRWSPEKAKEAGIKGPEELDYSQEEELARLRKWIFRLQMNRVRQKMGGGNRRLLRTEETSLLEEQQELF